jgi:hypothetical protein
VDDKDIAYCEAVVQDIQVVAAGLRPCHDDDDDLNSEVEAGENIGHDLFSQALHNRNGAAAHFN